MAIIGISGKKGHGKDLLAKIIQWLIFNKLRKPIGWTFELFADNRNQEDANLHSGFTKKMFAEKVKQIVCLLIGCTMEQLEDPDFKEKPLGKEWTVWYLLDMDEVTHIGELYISREELESKINSIQADLIRRDRMFIHGEILTPRRLMQLVGTDCGRKIIHPNIWVNATMAEYHPLYKHRRIEDNKDEVAYPNWIITDVRFPNEVKAIKDRGGIVIRIDRPSIGHTGNHESETSLDNYDGFHATIYNNDDGIDNLVKTTRSVLQEFKII